MSRYSIGLDMGSGYIKSVLLNGDRKVIWEQVRELSGQPRERLLQILDEIPLKGESFSLGFTGSGNHCLKGLFPGDPINNLVALTRGMGHILPQAKTIIEIGGESSRLFWVSEEHLTDFAMNNVCAAGTG